MSNDTLLKAGLALLAAVLAILTKATTDWISAEKELRQLIAELKDIERHYIENGKVISSMNVEKGIPSAMHFEKMKTPETSILFSAETFRRIQTEYAEIIYRMRLIIRNGNIELSEIIAYTKSEDCSPEILAEYLLYMHQKTEWVPAKINIWVSRLSRQKRKDSKKKVNRLQWLIGKIGTWLLTLYKREKIEWDGDTETVRPKQIIYDHSFPKENEVTTAAATFQPV